MQGQSDPNNRSDPPTPPTQPTTPQELSPSQRPISPPRSPESQNVLSPKSGSRRPQSPGVYKGKLDIVKKFLEKEEAKYSQFDAELTPLVQEKEALEQQLEEKQELAKKSSVISQGNGQSQKELEELRGKNQDLTLKIESLKKVQHQKVLTEKELLTGKIQVLKTELDSKRRQEEQQAADTNNKVNEVKNNVARYEAQARDHDRELAALNQKKQHLVDSNRQLEQDKMNIAREVELLNASNQSQQRQQELRRTQLEARIKQARERINSKKNELQDLKYKEGYFPDSSNTPAANDIKEAKKTADNLKAAIKKIQGQIAAKKRESSKNEDEEKKNEKKIEDLKKKVGDLHNKKDDLKTQIQTIDATLDKKPIKYEEKIPEELLAIKSKNEAIRKEIRKINEKIENQNVEMERLVPPAVIDNMNKKISTIIANNERLNEVSKIIEEVSRENEVLAQEREDLEWGENNYLRELESQRKKQEEKNKALEEELLSKKKNIQQQNAKLDEYVHAYPEFKPKKKPEPKEKVKKQSSIVNEGQKSPTAVKGKKQTSKSAINPPEEKPEDSKKGKKKKKTAESDIVKEEEKEQEVVQPEPPKKETTPEPPNKETAKSPQAGPTKKKNKKK